MKLRDPAWTLPDEAYPTSKRRGERIQRPSFAKQFGVLHFAFWFLGPSKTSLDGGRSAVEQNGCSIGQAKPTFALKEADLHELRRRSLQILRGYLRGNTYLQIATPSEITHSPE